MTPGVKTSEFYSMIVVAIIILGVSIVNSVAGLSLDVQNLLNVFFAYVGSRTVIKTGAAIANGTGKGGS